MKDQTAVLLYLNRLLVQSIKFVQNVKQLWVIFTNPPNVFATFCSVDSQ